VVAGLVPCFHLELSLAPQAAKDTLDTNIQPFQHTDHHRIHSYNHLFRRPEPLQNTLSAQSSPFKMRNTPPNLHGIAKACWIVSSPIQTSLANALPDHHFKSNLSSTRKPLQLGLNKPRPLSSLSRLLAAFLRRVEQTLDPQVVDGLAIILCNELEKSFFVLAVVEGLLAGASPFLWYLVLFKNLF
jgi:hypothetical protein